MSSDFIATDDESDISVSSAFPEVNNPTLHVLAKIDVYCRKRGKPGYVYSCMLIYSLAANITNTIIYLYKT